MKICEWLSRLRDRDVGEVGEIRVSRNVLDEVVIRGKSVLTSDAQHDPRFASGTMVLQGVRSVLLVPLGVSEKVFGIIYADSPIAEGRFTEDHLKVLTTLASVAAIRVENARLVEARLERERLERELALASEIQQRFQDCAAHPRLRVTGNQFSLLRDRRRDYYDFIEREDGRLVIALGDVSGKGTAAALLMSSLHTAIHAQSASHIRSWRRSCGQPLSGGQHSGESLRHVVLCGAGSGVGVVSVSECRSQSAADRSGAVPSNNLRQADCR